MEALVSVSSLLLLLFPFISIGKSLINPEFQDQTHQDIASDWVPSLPPLDLDIILDQINSSISSAFNEIPQDEEEQDYLQYPYIENKESTYYGSMIPPQHHSYYGSEQIYPVPVPIPLGEPYEDYDEEDYKGDGKGLLCLASLFGIKKKKKGLILKGYKKFKGFIKGLKLGVKALKILKPILLLFSPLLLLFGILKLVLFIALLLFVPIPIISSPQNNRIFGEFGNYPFKPRVDPENIQRTDILKRVISSEECVDKISCKLIKSNKSS